MIGSGRSIRGAPRGGSTPSPQNNAPRGTPSAAAQNAFRGLLRIVTPAVNLINRVVQSVTGGRGGISQLARGLTGLVNRVYQQATGQAWGAQGGTGGGTSGTAADGEMGEEDTPSLPPPPPDIGESDDRLRQLNEEEEETRPFNWQEFFGDDFTLEDIGESVRESAENFLRFVRGEVDTDVPLLTQIRTLFEEARGRLAGEVEPSPVDENWSNLTMEMLQEHFGDEWTDIYDHAGNVPADELITLIKDEAREQYGITFSDSLVGLSAEEVVALYRAELERRHAEIVNSGIGILARDRDSHEEIRRAYAFWSQVQNTFGVQQDITMDVSEFAINELGLPQTATPTEADAAIDSLIEEYIASGMIDAEAAQGMTREEIAYAYYEASQNRITSGEQWLIAAWNEHERLLAQVSNDPSVTNEHFEALRALEENIRTVTANIESLRPQTSESGNLVLAFNRMYEPTQPDAVLLLNVAAFFNAYADYAASSVDIAQSAAEGDALGVGLGLAFTFFPGIPGSAGRQVSRFVRNVMRRLFGGPTDEMIEAARRGVYIYDDAGNALTEVDRIDLDNQRFIEEKSALGLNPNAVRRDGVTPLYATERQRQKAISDWATNQIYESGSNRITAITSSSASYTGTIPSRNIDQSLVPTLDSFQEFRTLVFRIEATDPDVIAAVNRAIARLRSENPEWTITVVFGF